MKKMKPDIYNCKVMKGNENGPGSLAMATFPSREKLKYKPTTPDHLSGFQYDLDVH